MKTIFYFILIVAVLASFGLLLAAIFVWKIKWAAWLVSLVLGGIMLWLCWLLAKTFTDK